MDKKNIIIDVFFAVAGLMITIAPEKCIQVIVILLGCAAIIYGIVTLTTGLNIVDIHYFRTGVIITSCISIVVGILAIMLPLVFASVVWTAMVYMLAVYLLFMAFMRIIAIPSLKRSGTKIKKYVLEIILEIVIAVILFCIPASLGRILVRIIGILLIVGAVVLFLYQWKNRVIIEEADYVEDE